MSAGSYSSDGSYNSLESKSPSSYILFGSKSAKPEVVYVLLFQSGLIVLAMNIPVTSVAPSTFNLSAVDSNVLPLVIMSSIKMTCFLLINEESILKSSAGLDFFLTNVLIHDQIYHKSLYTNIQFLFFS